MCVAHACVTLLLMQIKLAFFCLCFPSSFIKNIFIVGRPFIYVLILCISCGLECARVTVLKTIIGSVWKLPVANRHVQLAAEFFRTFILWLYSIDKPACRFLDSIDNWCSLYVLGKVFLLNSSSNGSDWFAHQLSVL